MPAIFEGSLANPIQFARLSDIPHLCFRKRPWRMALCTSNFANGYYMNCTL